MTPDEWHRFHEFEDYLRWREQYQLSPPPQAEQPTLQPTKEHRSFRLTSSGRPKPEQSVAGALSSLAWNWIKLMFLLMFFIPLAVMVAALLTALFTG